MQSKLLYQVKNIYILEIKPPEVPLYLSAAKVILMKN